MKRICQTPRSNWKAIVEDLGLSFHTIDGDVYWDESAAYEFTSEQIDCLEQATEELEARCFDAVDHIIKNNLYHKLHIPTVAIPLIEASWKNGHKNLYGRFDFSYDGITPPKLLEYNADTPTALLEASVIQWQWLEETQKGKDQFNSIHEKLIEAWKKFDLPSKLIHFSCVTDHEEDLGTVNYLRDTALQAGLDPLLIDIREIGWDEINFVDLDDLPISTLFKLYPWEWMMEEDFAENIIHSKTVFIEPAWKMLLSNKGILPILWSLFPDHPNLLPSFTTPGHIIGDSVRKPFLSREGANIQIVSQDLTLATLGPYGSEGHVYQQYAPLPNFNGNYPVIGSWVIASQPAGIGIREDVIAITGNGSRFIPHYFL